MYEYRCPSCKATEERLHQMARVVCSKCGHEWLTGEAEPNITITPYPQPYVPIYPQPYVVPSPYTPPPIYPWWQPPAWGTGTATCEPIKGILIS